MILYIIFSQSVGKQKLQVQYGTDKQNWRSG
jgi:hypothetical protein